MIPVWRLLGLAAVALVASCDRQKDPRPQWVVHVSTDAPLPNFGDRIRVDVLDDAGVACPQCTQVFDLRGGEVLPLSFGIVSKAVKRVRARLFRAENTGADGEPTEPLIDYLGELPPLDSGPLDAEILLSMACFGKPADVEGKTSCDPTTGGLSHGLVLGAGSGNALPRPGSWGPAAEPCLGGAPAGMVCVPGGLFLLGSRQYVPFGTEFDPVPEQLVHVGAYFIDADELTVGALRSLLGGSVPAPLEMDALHPHCSFTANPGANEAMSISCVGRDAAKAACEAQGKRLPTEAEWEFAAGGGTLERPYPFELELDASSAAICSAAVVARAEPTDQTGSRQCILTGGYPVGPLGGGSDEDRNLLGLRNMGGNLSEWVSDDFAALADPKCWGADVELRSNPRCDSDPSIGVLKGGSWVSLTYDTHSFFRRPAPSALELPFVGFRCVKDVQ